MRLQRHSVIFSLFTAKKTLFSPFTVEIKDFRIVFFLFFFRNLLFGLSLRSFAALSRKLLVSVFHAENFLLNYALRYLFIEQEVWGPGMAKWTSVTNGLPPLRHFVAKRLLTHYINIERSYTGKSHSILNCWCLFCETHFPKAVIIRRSWKHFGVITKISFSSSWNVYFRDARWNKGTILKAAVDYIHSLQKEQTRVRQAEMRAQEMESINKQLHMRVQVPFFALFIFERDQ